MVAGTIMYQVLFKNIEMRTLTYWSAFLGMFIYMIDYVQAKRWNLDLGISDMFLLCFGSSIIYAVQFALTQLPSIVLFQKLIPPHVESTMSAFSAGIVNISNGLLGQMIGVAVNKWFIGVTSDDLTNYPAIPLIGLGCCFYELLIIQLIPVQSDIDEAIVIRQKEREEAVLASTRRDSEITEETAG